MVRFALVFRVVICSFYLFSFGHYVVCPYLFTDSDYLFGIFKLSLYIPRFLRINLFKQTNRKVEFFK